LSAYCNHPIPEISETCQIAKNLLEWRHLQESVPKGLYLSVDPAPPLAENKTVAEHLNLLMDVSQSLFLRYRAMFSLRDANSDESALALEEGFKDNSALFRHEIAYVLGQMQRRCSVPGLCAVLQNTSEHAMVRHEAAEALGAIGGTDVECLLEGYLNDSEAVVKESCVVALDTIDYWNNN
jgi:deoxyhypusine monooxygenase